MKLAECQRKLFEEFSQIIRENRLSHAYLFSGDFGSLDMAIWLAQSRFCLTPEDGLPCSHCRPCRLIAQGDFSDVKLVEPQGQIIKTDIIRQLTREFSQSSFEGHAQVFIIRDADKMHVNAANSLLKFIEEPQSQIYIFLLTADDSRILPTIKSRAQLFYFPKNKAYLEDLLQREGLLLTQAKVLADFAKDETQALSLSKDKKVLDVIDIVERFEQSLLANHDLLYLDVAKLAVQCSEKSDLNRVEGLASERDFARYDENLLKAEQSMGVVADLIAQNQLDMKVVDIVFPLNSSYVLISFVAEKRVDFRQLLEDLAAYFKTRIELRQISSREESKIYGGLGPCGRALCCSSFLGEFPPVSIKMAKNQSFGVEEVQLNGKA